jgi:hypothetical protein
MHTRLNWIVTGLAILFASGCAPITQTSELAQPVGQVLQVGVGGTVLTVNTEKSLPNAFGKADIFGRTTPSGITTIQFMGSDGQVVHFVRSSVVISSDATTMNSTPTVIPNVGTTTTTGTVGMMPYSSTSTTYGPPTVIPAVPPASHSFSLAPVSFELNLLKQRSFIAGGVRITIIRATALSLAYRIDKNSSLRGASSR